MFTKPNPFIQFVVWVLSSFGVAVVVDGGNDDYPTARGYATTQAALTAGATFILALPGIYAENLIVVSGVRVILLGATVGTGAGPAVTIASGSATIGGWGSLSATAAISAAVGAYLDLGPGVDISGTVSGVYRVGRRWVLQSGLAVATYCPADGSVVPVVAGDQLYHGTTGLYLTATLCGATMRWLGPQQSCGIQTSISVSASYQIAYPVPAAASGVWHTYWEGNLYVGAPNDVSNKWDIGLYSSGVLIDTFNTWTTINMVPTDMYRFRRGINSYAANVADGTKVLVGAVTWDYFLRAKQGTPGALFGSLSFAYCPVYE